jgi:hypothetical protein
MNPKYRDALIAALEVPPDEGGYTKGEGQLVWEGTPDDPHDKFCCLGVAANQFGLWEVEGYDQETMLNQEQLYTIGMSQHEQEELSSINDDYDNDTFGPVIEALRGM